jgi:DNA-binding MarR family transcriptional regulator
MRKGVPRLAPSELGEIAATCACFSLRKAARVVTQIYDRALRPSGLGAAQFNLLVAVALLEAPTVTHLARVLAMDPTTLVRNLAPLTRDRLVRVDPGKDRRTRNVTLTENGSVALSRAMPLWRRAQARIVQHVGAERLPGFAERLGALAALGGHL